MKRIIKGKLYSTETATCIGSYEYSNPRDFHYLREELYRKNNGEFFLCGEGGPLSKYREQVDSGGWTSGEAIIPLTIEEAKAWCENHLSADSYIELFGEPEE
jgi:hypothetical protein